MKQLFFFREYLEQTYGKALQRIPFDLGFSCPNRRKDGSGGCAFCAGNGSAARHLSGGMSPGEQAERGIRYVRERYQAEPPYVAYFQSYTNTYADIAVLRQRYEEALATADYRAVVIATRPDCLDDACIRYLAELKQRYDVWVELGVQTANDETLKRINRGHDFASVENAVKQLAAHGISCAAHVILGLPGETRADYRATAQKIAELPFSAVKVHNLLILKGTPMVRMLQEGQVTPLNEYEYAQALAEFLSILPEKTILMRLCADADEHEIAAPKWWMKKGQFLSMFESLFRAGADGAESRIQAVPTEDGSYTLYHPEYRQHFHSVAGARTESWKKYIEPCRIAERLARQETVSVLDIGFGMGYNVAALAELAEREAGGKLTVRSLEMDPKTLDAARMLPGFPRKDVLDALAEQGGYESEFFSADIVWGDARQYPLHAEETFDFIFLDAFSPDQNPELWTLEFIASLKQILKPSGRLATYSSAYPFLGALLRNGFLLYESEPFGRRRGGTVASLTEIPDLQPLREKDLRIASRSTAGTPYSDPSHQADREEIRSSHAAKIQELRAAGIPKWYKD